MKFLLALASVILGTSAGLLANDTLATLGAGGLVPVKSTEIALDTEDLDISVHQVRVRYAFRNASDHDVEAVVAFPLPEIDGGNLFHVPTAILFSNSVNFLDFKVEELWSAPGSGSAAWNRKAIATETALRAFHDHEDVTEKLNRLRLPISVLDSRVDASIAALTPQTREACLKDDLIGMEETQGVDNIKRRLFYPWWSTRVQFYWRQRFPANTTTVLEQTYAPVVGGGYIVKNGGETKDLVPFCVSPRQQENIAEQLSRSPATYEGSPVLLEREINYILTTANNWNGPIGEFRLTVHADSPQDLVITCMAGLTQTSSTEYRLTRSHFRPDRELDVMIVQKNQ